MRITLKVYGKEKDVETNYETIEDLVRNEGMNPESFLVKRNGNFVPAEESLTNGDEIELINIVSSG